MTNDSRKGWRYKLRTDANARKRREPEIRNKVERFRRRTKDRAKCTSQAKSRHAGPLEVQHQGGLRADARLTWMCRRHNREDAGITRGKYQPEPRPRPKPARPKKATKKAPAKKPRPTTKPRPWWRRLID